MVVLNKSVKSEYRPATATQWPKYRSAEGQTLMHERNEKFDGTSRLIIACHGHGGNADQLGQNVGPGSGTSALARTGRYIVLSIDASGPIAWGNADAQQAILDAVTYARGLGARPGKYGLVGWSMGGGTSLIHISNHPDDVAGAWLWVPACDLRFFANTYSNPYGAAPITGYAADFSTAYPSGAASIAALDPMQNIAKFQGINVPTYFALASDDTTIPPAQADYFLAQVNNPHLFQSPKGKVTGGHTALFDKFTDDEFVAHFDSLSWDAVQASTTYPGATNYPDTNVYPGAA